ncbi:MAG TPA: hypothetical protein VL053_17425 [Arachidicoccus sp.]|nr:hypothetical protein [Arachidicoccus sp.]
MQSFIINIPEDKVAFFLQLAEELDFEVLDIEDQEAQQQPASNKKAAPQSNDPFLDWDEERKNAKKNKY